MRARILFTGILLFSAAAAPAEDRKDAKQLQAVNQRLAAEKAALERDKAVLLRDKAALTKERDTLKADLDTQSEAATRNGAEARRLRAETGKQRAELAAAAEREAELKDDLAKTSAALKEAKQTGEQLARRLANQGETSRYWQAKTELCEAKNTELAKIGADLLERYRDKSCLDAQAQNEPFTGIARVRLENLMEEYKDRVAASRFKTADPLPEEEKKK
jgi:hypothetical protein